MTSVSGSVTSRSGYGVGAMAWLQFKHSTGFEAGRKKACPDGQAQKALSGSERGAGCLPVARYRLYEPQAYLHPSTGLPRRTGGSTPVKSSQVQSETPVSVSVKEAAIAAPVIPQPRRHRRYRNPGSVAISP